MNLHANRLAEAVLTGTNRSFLDAFYLVVRRTNTLKLAFRVHRRCGYCERCAQTAQAALSTGSAHCVALSLSLTPEDFSFRLA